MTYIEKPCADCGGRGLKQVPIEQTGRYSIEECDACDGLGYALQSSKAQKQKNFNQKRRIHARTYR